MRICTDDTLWSAWLSTSLEGLSKVREAATCDSGHQSETSSQARHRRRVSGSEFKSYATPEGVAEKGAILTP
jgi:hypothetical protein